MTRQIHGTGTSEHDWLEQSPLPHLPCVTAAELVPPGGRTVIVAPHPDDEILPCGALLRQLHALDRELLIIAVTDGEASHPPGSWWTPQRLHRQRPEETTLALAALGCPCTVVRLGLPDGGISCAIDYLTESLVPFLSFSEVVFCPWSLDGHPDHEATATACAVACAANDARLVEMPIWGWHWSSPSTTPMPWDRAVRLPLAEEDLQRKRRAIAAFQSQVQPDPDTHAPPILTLSTLQRFERPWEVYFQ